MDDSRDMEGSAARVWAAAESGNDASANDSAAVTKAAFTIGELSREFGVTLRALRFYENKGLISPHRDGLNRLYSQGDRTRLALILKGKKLGFTLTEISEMVEAEAGRATQHGLKLTAEKCEEQIKHFERQIVEAGEALQELRRIHTLFTRQMGG